MKLRRNQYLPFLFFALFLLLFKAHHALSDQAPTKNSFIKTRSLFRKGKQKIWIHAGTTEDVASIEGLVHSINQQIPNAKCFITTVTVEAKKQAEYFMKSHYVRIIPHDDLETMSFAFHSINPKAIIMLRHEISPSLILLARFYNIPIYLLNGKYSNRTERLLNTTEYLYLPLFNTFNAIFAESNDDAETFKNIGIIKPKVIISGPIHAYNIFGTKKFYLNLLHTTEEKIRNLSSHPLIVLHSFHREKLTLYFDIFKELKADYPNLRMVLTPGSTLSWKTEFLHKIKQTPYRYFIWDKQTKFQKGSMDASSVLNQVKELLQETDIILSCADGLLFFWNSLASLYVIDEAIASIHPHCFSDAAVWRTPTIIGPINNFRLARIEKEILKSKAAISVSSKKELLEQIKEILTNSHLRKDLEENAFRWIQQLSNQVDKTLKILLKLLAQDIKRNA